MYTAKQAYGIDHDRDSDAETFLVEAIRDYARASEDLQRQVESVRAVCDRVERYLDEEYQVNELGELQGRAGDFDRCCAKRYAAGQAVTKLAWQLKTTGALSEERMDYILSQTPFAREVQS